MPLLLEVCVTSPRSAVAAATGGAHRIELCVNLEDGGMSPSASLLGEVRAAVEIGIHVMVRPRPGDFCYSESAFESMKEEIQQAKVLGANGVVFGILKSDKTIDMKRTRELVQLAHPLSVTFHRAFDETPDPVKALEDVIQTGADLLLTSGQEPSAFEGRECIRGLVKRAGNRIRILAGAGINEENVRRLINETGVTQVHVARSVQKDGETTAGLVRRMLFSMNDNGEMN